VEAILALEDGRIFRGRAFGAPGERAGEVVFNTALTGYQEILTDPSYRGQIVTMTCPEIGNVGTNGIDLESETPQVEGFVVRELSDTTSSWRSNQGLHEYLREHRVPGIAEVDTRALTRHLRTRGAMKGVVASGAADPETLVRKAKQAPGLEAQDLVRAVTCAAPYGWSAPREPRFAAALDPAGAGKRLRLAAFDFGAKRNIFRLLWEIGFDVTVVPATFSAADVRALAPDAVFLSNGPGDPETCTYAIRTVRDLLGKVPIFGICLGHQIAGLALDARTFKLKFGHRGANHPVKDLRTSKVSVTSQNHGYAVDPDSLPRGAVVTHLNLNDGTCEGFLHPEARLLAVQYHPESSPGPHDSLSLFREFREMARGTGATRSVASEGRQ
jgi:carbamoyl-phosphate synthase small subunit